MGLCQTGSSGPGLKPSNRGDSDSAEQQCIMLQQVVTVA